MVAVQETIDHVKEIDVDKYKYGFKTDIEMDMAPKGLNEDIVRFISAKKEEPEWMLEWRLDAFRRWQQMEEPKWARVDYPAIDFQDLYYYAAPKSTPGPKSLDEVDPELLETYKKLGIPLQEQAVLAGVEGAKIAICARNKERLDGYAVDIAKAGGDVIAIPILGTKIPTAARTADLPDRMTTARRPCALANTCVTFS